MFGREMLFAAIPIRALRRRHCVGGGAPINPKESAADGFFLF